MLVNVLANSPLVAVQALERPDLAAKVHLIELVTHIPLTIVLVSLLGVVGAALAWLIRVVMHTCLLWWATIKLIGLKWLETMTAMFSQGLRITIAKLGYMGSFVSRTNSNFCRTVLRLSDSVVSNTAHCYLRTII